MCECLSLLDPGLCPRADGRCPVSVFLQGLQVKADYVPLLQSLATFGWRLTCVLPTPVIRTNRYGPSSQRTQLVFVHPLTDKPAANVPDQTSRGGGDLGNGDRVSLVRTNPTEKIQSTSWVRHRSELGGRPRIGPLLA